MSTHFDSDDIASVIGYVKNLKSTVGKEGVSDTTEALYLLSEQCEKLISENEVLKSLVIDTEAVVKQIQSNSDITRQEISAFRSQLDF